MTLLFSLLYYTVWCTSSALALKFSFNSIDLPIDCDQLVWLLLTSYVKFSFVSQEKKSPFWLFSYCSSTPFLDIFTFILTQI